MLARNLRSRRTVLHPRAMPPSTDDMCIETLKPLLPPAILMEEIPISDAESQLIATSRGEVAKILEGQDDRLLVIVGPCSIHDPAAGLEYARRLKRELGRFASELLLVMRTYF